MIQNTRNIKIKMFAKTLFAFAFALCLFKPLTADAAVIAENYPYTYEKLFASEDEGGFDCIFDSTRYAAENPDVVAVIGNDPTALFNHYVVTGHLEGRKGYALLKDGSSDMSTNFDMRTLEFIDTHITDDMTQLQKFQIVWDYLLDRNNRVNISAGCEKDDSVVLFTKCMNALGIEREDADDEWYSSQQRVWLDGTAYIIHIEWAEK